ncbi:MAG TPA: hypothetical protein VH107_08170 [Lacipirellulaceae bacterium]|jgi:hypothetical protein|nr:hypothetical protein [Lacipirellulaceae bacterium]
MMQGLLAVARRRRGNDAETAWIVIGVALATIAVVGAVALISRRKRRKRAEAMERIAAELRLEYRPVGSDGLVAQLSSFQLFSKGRSKKVANMLQGGSGERRLAIFDYQYTTGGGKSTHVWKTTVLNLSLDGPAMPACMLRRKQVGDTIASWFRGRGIEFVGRPMFSKRYLLRGDDEPAIRAVFTEPVVTYFEENPGLFVEAAGNAMLVYRLGKNVRPEEIGEFLGKGLELLGVMRAG